MRRSTTAAILVWIAVSLVVSTSVYAKHRQRFDPSPVIKHLIFCSEHRPQTILG
jgi:hypothetical protein